MVMMEKGKAEVAGVIKDIDVSWFMDIMWKLQTRVWQLQTIWLMGEVGRQI